MLNTPRANRVHIAFFGNCNVGKSSLLNAISDQEHAIVSKNRGTTTDPVYKSMELLPLGPVVLVDTAGLDDKSLVGELRVKKTLEVLNKTDIAVIVVDPELDLTDDDSQVIELVEKKKIPYVVVVNKIDAYENIVRKDDYSYVSSVTKEGIHELKEKLATFVVKEESPLVHDLFEENDVIVLVTPIDSAAPKGRLILPQQQVVRDILDFGGIVMACREFELESTLKSLKNPPKLVITDSQAFEMVSEIVPVDVLLTSFSILFARYKGDLRELIKGAELVEKLPNKASILVAEGCTHHRQKDDIGTVKIPKWLREYTKKELTFTHFAGHGFPENISDYDLVIHCGGCMLNEKEMKHRINTVVEHDQNVVNYGVLIAYLNGILARTTEVFNQ